MLPQKLNPDGTVKERPLPTLTPGSDLPTAPEIMDIDDVIDGLNHPNDDIRDTCRDFLGHWIRPVSPEVEQKQRMSRMMREKFLEQRNGATERKRKQRHRDAIKAGRATRSYKKRKR